MSLGRCEHVDTELLFDGEGRFIREKRSRCPDPADWVYRGGMYCDTHTRQHWDHDLLDLWTPRDRPDGRDPDSRYPAWITETLRNLADRYDATGRMTATPAQGVLDLGAAA